MATSQSSQLGQRVHLGYQSRQHWARSLSGRHAQPGGDHLQEDGHQAGDADDPQQAVLVFRSAGQIGAPVARIHVADADQDGRTDKGAPLPPKTGVVLRNVHRIVHSFERKMADITACPRSRRGIRR